MCGFYFVTEFRTGKTQLSHTLCGKNILISSPIPSSPIPSSPSISPLLYLVSLYTVTTQLPGRNGYSGGKVVFIDTEVRMLQTMHFVLNCHISLLHILLLLAFRTHCILYSILPKLLACLWPFAHHHHKTMIQAMHNYVSGTSMSMGLIVHTQVTAHASPKCRA